MDVKKESKELTDSIYELFKGKLIHQFRKPEWEKKIEANIKNLVDATIKKAVISTYNNTKLEYNKLIKKNANEIEQQYLELVKKAGSTFKGRIKFLFTGSI